MRPSPNPCCSRNTALKRGFHQELEAHDHRSRLVALQQSTLLGSQHDRDEAVVVGRAEGERLWATRIRQFLEQDATSEHRFLGPNSLRADC